jgi:peptide deformylase
MSVAAIRTFPDEVLRTACRPVAIEDHDTMRQVQQLVQTLKQTMYESDGVGLAAPQIGVPVRVFVVHVRQESKLPIVFVNPRVISTQFDPVELVEGCLSFPGIREPVSRPSQVTCQRWDEYGRTDMHIFSGWTARAVLHELEHLDGKLLIDHMLPAARKMVERSMERKQREAAKRVEENQRISDRRTRLRAKKRAQAQAANAATPADRATEDAA